MSSTHPTMQRLFEATKMQPSELATALNTSPQNITNWSARGISKKGAMQASQLLGVDANYILTGESGIEALPTRPLIPTQKTVGVLDPKNPPTSTHRRIIRYEVRLAAGEGKGTADWIVRENDDDPIYFRNGWFRARHLDEENLRGMYVRGDSMEPYLFNHDTVIIDVADTEISDGEVYAIVFKNRFYVKELRLMEGGVRIISHNEKYEAMEALDEDCKEEHDFQVLGRVVWRGG